MMRRLVCRAVPLLTLGVLVALADSSAWAGPPSGGRSYSRRAGAYGSSSAAYAAPTYAVPVNAAPAAPASAAASTTTGAFYYAPDGAPGTSDANAAVIHVTVPTGAEIWFNNYKTKSTGATRTFVSPPLDPNQSHRYHVRVRWLENGQEVVQERDVAIAPGRQTSVRFRGLPGAEDS